VKPEIYNHAIDLYKREEEKLYPIPPNLKPYGRDYCFDLEVLRRKILDYVGNPGTRNDDGKALGWKKYAGLLSPNIKHLEELTNMILLYFQTTLPFAWQYTKYGINVRFANYWERADKIIGTNQNISRKILLFHSWQFDFEEEDAHLDNSQKRLKPPKLVTAYVVTNPRKSHRRYMNFPNFGIMGCENFLDTPAYRELENYSLEIAQNSED
jgi:hypothetical protein